MKSHLIIDAPIMGQKRVWVKKFSQPHFDHPYHFHKLCELTWLEKGDGKLIIGDYVGNFFDGELILLSPDLPHLWKCGEVHYRDEKPSNTKAVVFYFPPELVRQLTDDEISIERYDGLMRRAELGLKFHGKTKEKIIKKIQELAKCSVLSQLGIFLQIIDLLSDAEEFDALASVGYKQSTNENDMKRFNDVYLFLLANFNRDIMLDEVADICNMTPNAFCRFFKQKTQKTFVNFLNEIRIGHAKKILQDINVPIKDLSYQCGFNNSSSFFSLFKQATGKTPKEFRQQFDAMN